MGKTLGYHDKSSKEKITGLSKTIIDEATSQITGQIVDERYSRHKQMCSICNGDEDYRSFVNRELLRGVNVFKVMRTVNDMGASFHYNTVKHHAKYLPYMLAEEEIVIENEVQNKFISSQIEYVANRVRQAKLSCVDKAWTETIPALLDHITKSAESGAIPMKELATALQTVVTAAADMADRPVVQKQEVTHIVQASAADKSNPSELNNLGGAKDHGFAIEAINAFNNALNGFHASGGESEVGAE